MRKTLVFLIFLSSAAVAKDPLAAGNLIEKSWFIDKRQVIFNLMDLQAKSFGGFVLIANGSDLHCPTYLSLDPEPLDSTEHKLATFYIHTYHVETFDSIILHSLENYSAGNKTPSEKIFDWMEELVGDLKTYSVDSKWQISKDLRSFRIQHKRIYSEYEEEIRLSYKYFDEQEVMLTYEILSPMQASCTYQMEL